MIGNFPEGQYIFSTSKIDYNFGGLTEAMLQRGRLFKEYVNQDSIIVTFNYSPEFDEIVTSLQARQKLTPGIQVFNVYDFFKGETSTKIHANFCRDIEEENLKHHRVENKKDSYRYYKEGLYLKYKRFDVEDNLVLIDYFNENRIRTCREEFHKMGYLHKKTYMDFMHNVPRQELYYRNDGTCYMSKWLYKDTEADKLRIERIHLFNPKGEVINVFKKQRDLELFFLKTIIGDKTTFLIGEERGTDPITLEIEMDNVYKIYMTHNIHVRKPYHYSSVLKLGNRPVMNQMSKPEAVVFLTEKQKTDIVKRFGNRTNYFVIPHAIKEGENDLPFEQRDLNKVVMFARYHEQKQLDHAIKAFAKVTDELPNAKLEIFGFGDKENELNVLIRSLGMEHSIQLKGFNDNPADTFKKSAVSLLTSEYEGFGLVVLESLRYGCPVISYDLKYGPSDMISNGENGYLVENLNISQLAEKIIKTLNSKNELKSLSDNAFQSSKKFGEENFIINWRKLFYKVLEDKQRKHQFTDMNTCITSNNSIGNSFVLKGDLLLTGQASSEESKGTDYSIVGKIYDRKTKDFICIPTVSIDKKSMSEFAFEIDINFSHSSIESFIKNSSPTLDLSVGIEWRNISFEKRLGLSKNVSRQFNSITTNGLLIKPYLTENHENLSFKIEKKKSFIKNILK